MSVDGDDFVTIAVRAAEVSASSIDCNVYLSAIRTFWHFFVMQTGVAPVEVDALQAIRALRGTG